MSVLLARRVESKAEYVMLAYQIYEETINFLSRLSARYARLIATPIANLAGEVMDHAEKAQKIYPSDEQRKSQRKAHLLEARAALGALDVRLTHAYIILNMNPQGAFTNSKGESKKSEDAIRILNNMSKELGLKIIEEDNKLKKLLENDAKRK